MRLISLLLSASLLLASFPPEALSAAPRAARPGPRLQKLVAALAARLPVRLLALRAKDAARAIELDKDQGAQVFEAESSTQGLTLPPSFPAAPALRLELSKPLAKPKPSARRDRNGGPPHLELSRPRQALYGLQWGINLAGLGALAQVCVEALCRLYHWPLAVPSQFLDALGRAELMAFLGPADTSRILETHPWLFFLAGIPALAALEEVLFRGVEFGLAFYALAALGPLSNKASRVLEALPELFSWGPLARNALALATFLSRKAFPLAAGLSALGFTAAHFPRWGVEPVFMAQHLILGLALAHAAYRTRSLIAPIAAHAAYNAISLLPLDPALKQLIGIGALAHLYYFTRASQKAGAPGLARKVLAAAFFGLLAFSAPRFAAPALAPAAPAPRVASTAQPATLAPKPTSPAPRPILTDEAAIASAKPSVLRIITDEGIGSGVIITAEGLVLTNAHVAAAAGRGGQVQVDFTDGRQMKGLVLDINPDKDIALIQLPARLGGWALLPLAEPASLAEGQKVLALGYPQFQPFSASAGIISGIGERSNGHVSYVQTDAAVNHGNSGGPLINNKGEIVGLNTMGIAGAEGLNMAISSEDLARALAQYGKLGHLRSPWLGIVLDRGGDTAQDKGLAVEAVRPGSPAARAGIESGDVLLGTDFEALEQALSRLQPGEKLSLRIARQGAIFEKEAVLGER